VNSSSEIINPDGSVEREFSEVKIQVQELKEQTSSFNKLTVARDIDTPFEDDRLKAKPPRLKSLALETGQFVATKLEQNSGPSTPKSITSSFKNMFNFNRSNSSILVTNKVDVLGKKISSKNILGYKIQSFEPTKNDSLLGEYQISGFNHIIEEVSLTPE
jgi:hypothetical protein